MTVKKVSMPNNSMAVFDDTDSRVAPASIKGIVLAEGGGSVTHVINSATPAHYDGRDASTAVAFGPAPDASLETLAKPVAIKDFISRNRGTLTQDLGRTLERLSIRPQAMSSIPDAGKGV